MATAEEIEMAFDPVNFSAGIRISAEQAGKVFARWTLHDATWEPHDWSDFD